MRIGRQLTDLARQLDKIEVALIVRDPGTSLSADAYDGLRRQIIVAVQERTAHLVQLAAMDEAVRNARDTQSLRALTEEWMTQAGLRRVEDPYQEPWFEIVAGKGEERELVAPAYVDAASNRLIKQGRAKAREAASDPEPSRGDEASKLTMGGNE